MCDAQKRHVKQLVNACDVKYRACGLWNTGMSALDESMTCGTNAGAL